MNIVSIRCDKCEREMCYPHTFISQSGGEKYLCLKCTEDFNEWLNDCVVEKVYDLNFKQALVTMLMHNKSCECENGEQFRFNHEFFLFETLYMGSWGACDIELNVQAKRWRVV